MSKGSKPRPYDITQYGDNFDDIFNKKIDNSIQREQSEILMGAIRQSNEQKLDKEIEDMFYAEECCEPYCVDCSDDE